MTCNDHESGEGQTGTSWPGRANEFPIEPTCPRPLGRKMKILGFYVEGESYSVVDDVSGSHQD